jgi:hypothetical protein
VAVRTFSYPDKYLISLPDAVPRRPGRRILGVSPESAERSSASRYVLGDRVGSTNDALKPV